MVDLDALNAEIRANYQAFESQLEQLIESDHGKFCLLRHGQIIDKFDTAADAHRAGVQLYEDRIFSIQEIENRPAELGYFSHALAGF